MAVQETIGAPAKAIRIGVDTGGTFTDLLALDERGLHVYKLRSVPADPSRAILAGIRALVGDDLTALPLEVTHGSTVATNAVLERKGARVAMVTTAGFEDVLRIGRQTRRELYNFMVRRPEPLVSPELTFGLHERVAADGSVRLASAAAPYTAGALAETHGFGAAFHLDALAFAVAAALWIFLP